MPADTTEAQLSMKCLLQDAVPTFLWNREIGRQPACWSTWLFLCLVFPLPSFCKYIRQPFESENYKVLLFLNNQESFGHCFCALKSLSLRPFGILGEPVISGYLKQQDLSHLFQVSFLFSLFRIKRKIHHQQIIFTIYMVAFFYLISQYCFVRQRLVEVFVL